MRGTAVLVAAVAVPVLGVASPGAAGWSSSAGGGATAAAHVLVNATGLTAGCTSRSAKSTVTLEWSASPDTSVTGYTLVRTSSSGAIALIPIPDRTTTQHVDDGMQVTGETYTYEIRAVAGGTTWTTALLGAIGSPSYTGSRGSCVTL